MIDSWGTAHCPFQVSYSQCLGVIGYSVLPLVITALVLPLFAAFHYVAMLIKVGIVINDNKEKKSFYAPAIRRMVEGH